MSTRSLSTKFLPKIGERYQSHPPPVSVSDFLNKAGLNASPTNTRELAIMFDH